jgi:ribonuclease Z
MDCVVLGNGGMMPMPLRLTTSLLVRRQGRMIMFDAGEGIQLALKKGGFGIAALDAVAISHLHADHILGLPGVMMFRAQNENPTPLTLVGPPGLARFVKDVVGGLSCHINYPYHVIEWHPDAPAEAYVWHDVVLSWFPLDHSTFCLGYRLDEPQRPGRFNPDAAAALGVPKGPLFGKLQIGETVTLDDGAIVSPSAVLGPERPGRSVGFATDTRPCQGLEQAIHGTDIAFIEGMFSDKHSAEALRKKHMTTREAATAAKAAGAQRVVLVHISPRYSTLDEQILEAEARSVLSCAEISKPLGIYPIPLKP